MEGDITIDGADQTAGDAPAEPTTGQKMDAGLRWFSDHFFRPLLWLFSNLGLSPNLITILGMALAIASGYFIAVSKIPLAAILFTLSGIFDIIDGYVAKKLNKITVFGSFLDSFSDRIGDAAVYIGLMVYYLKLADGIYVGLALVLLVVSFLISYIRARAEALDVPGKAGLMARAPRIFAICAGLYFNGLSPWVLKVVMWILAALMVETLVARLFEVWRALER